jgi:hypothetical protein
MPVRAPGEWQAETIRRLLALGYDGFTFGPGVNWLVIDGVTRQVAGGPFISTDEFDAWLTEQEKAPR